MCVGKKLSLVAAMAVVSTGAVAESFDQQVESLIRPLANGLSSVVFFKIDFFGFIALGCMIQLTAVLDFSDAMVFLIAIPNILGLYLFAPEVKREVNGYIARIRSGEVKLNAD